MEKRRCREKIKERKIEINSNRFNMIGKYRVKNFMEKRQRLEKKECMLIRKECKNNVNTVIRMTAEQMFKELGFPLYVKNNSCIMYRCRTDYDDIIVTFYTGDENCGLYNISASHWFDNNSNQDWVPMNKRRENLKHCAKYGQWQKDDYDVPVDLHKAIHQKLKELGCLDE